MKKSILLACAVATSAVVLTGCQYPNGEANNTGTGALVGAGVGATSGALLAGRNGAEGALIGGAIGAIAGTMVGSSIDEQQREELRSQAPTTYVHVQQGQPLTTSDVKALVQAKVSDDVIISQIQSSHTIYHLSATDIIDLHTAGVSDKVVNFMIRTANSSDAATVVQSAPPPPRTDIIVAAPGPGYVWVDGEWSWNGVEWVWLGGHWVYPPHSGVIWVRGGWYHGPHGWYHDRGHWR